ncbi:hypothetical protein GXW82_02420 [Streptacidiphilus sp. 4-A2]|nr:hypothetical protein [Streptacidiphilus sp. 4-A2]
MKALKGPADEETASASRPESSQAAVVDHGAQRPAEGRHRFTAPTPAVTTSTWPGR